MSDEETPDIEDALRTAILSNLTDAYHAKNFARNIANLIHAACLKAPEGSELEADLVSVEQYAVQTCFYYQGTENGLREVLIQAGAAEQSGPENDTNHSIH